MNKTKIDTTVPAGFKAGSILDLLAFVAGAEFPPFLSPLGEIAAGQALKHTMSGDLAKRLFSAAQ